MIHIKDMFDTAALHLYHLGKGPTLIILPSPLIMSATYRHLAKTLSSDFSVYVPELPASGFHFSDQKVWNAEEYAHWVLSFMDSYKISKAIILGHSNSGAIALHAARIAPHRFEALVLADTIGVQSQFPLKVLGGRALDALLEFVFSVRAAPHLFINALLHFRNFVSQVWTATRLDLSSSFKEIQTPVKIVWGERDHTMPLQLGFELQNQLPNSEIYISKSGSHDWILTQPEEFKKILKEALRKQPEKIPLAEL